jgi:hypothetical protein
LGKFVVLFEAKALQTQPSIYRELVAVEPNFEIQSSELTLTKMCEWGTVAVAEQT